MDAVTFVSLVNAWTTFALRRAAASVPVQPSVSACAAIEPVTFVSLTIDWTTFEFRRAAASVPVQPSVISAALTNAIAAASAKGQRDVRVVGASERRWRLSFSEVPSALFHKTRSLMVDDPGPVRPVDDEIANGVRGEAVLLPQTVFAAKMPLHWACAAAGARASESEEKAFHWISVHPPLITSG